MNLPLQIYDFIGILIPGAIAAIIIKIEYPAWVLWQLESSTAQLAVLFAWSYAGGQLLQGSSRCIWNLINSVKTKCFSTEESRDQAGADAQPAPDAGATVTEGTVRGRHYILRVSKPFEDEIKNAFKDTFNIEMETLSSEESFVLMFSCAQEKMGQRQVFVAIANFNRCLASLFILYMFYLCVKVIYLVIRPDMVLYTPQTIALFVLILFSLLFAVHNADYFKKMSDQIPFAAFLSWYKEQHYRCRQKS